MEQPTDNHGTQSCQTVAHALDHAREMPSIVSADRSNGNQRDTQAYPRSLDPSAYKHPQGPPLRHQEQPQEEHEPSARYQQTGSIGAAEPLQQLGH